MQQKFVPVIILADVNVVRRSSLRRLLDGSAQLLECNTLGELIARTRNADHHVIVLGSLLDAPNSSLEAVLRLRPEQREKVVFMADQSSENLATSALEKGICKSFSAPISLEEVARVVVGLLPHNPDRNIDDLVGESASMSRVKDLIRRFGKGEAPVLITGETGTGKELVASSIHRNSSRAKAPMVTINCAAIPDSLVESELFGFEKGAFTGASTSQKGKIALAHGGTIFLDEVGDMSRLAQAKVLRALESGEIQPLGAKKAASVDVRVIAATHQNLEAMIADGEFRSDLYYRLNVTSIHIPPLRERLNDLPELASHIVSQLRTKRGQCFASPTPAVLDLLRQHDWPGNVRELRNVLESAFWHSISGQIEPGDVPQFRRASDCSTGSPFQRRAKSATLPLSRTSSERDDLMRALEATRWNKSQTAEILQWSRMTVYRKIDQYGLSSEPSAAVGAGD